MRYKSDTVRASSNRDTPVEARQRAQVLTDLVLGQTNHAPEITETKTAESKQGPGIRTKVTANPERREAVFKVEEKP